MTDLIANPDCLLCKGTGVIMERRPDYWGMPCSEFVMCDCFEEEEDDHQH